mgnify:CR=1 FL=1
MMASPPFITKAGCSSSATSIIGIFENATIFIPNAFSPDGNELNQYFQIEGNKIDPSDFSMQIFNRWGELIFLSNSIDTHWNGTYNGLKSPDGVYVWKIKYRDLNGIDYEEYGHVTLLR